MTTIAERRQSNPHDSLYGKPLEIEGWKWSAVLRDDECYWCAWSPEGQRFRDMSWRVWRSAEIGWRVSLDTGHASRRTTLAEAGLDEAKAARMAAILDARMVELKAAAGLT